MYIDAKAINKAAPIAIANNLRAMGLSVLPWSELVRQNIAGLGLKPCTCTAACV